jgi:hypothetical protein
LEWFLISSPGFGFRYAPSRQIRHSPFLSKRQDEHQQP